MCRPETWAYQECLHSSAKMVILCELAIKAKASGTFMGYFGRNPNGTKACIMKQEHAFMYNRNRACPLCDPASHSEREIKAFKLSKNCTFQEHSPAQRHLKNGPKRHYTKQTTTKSAFDVDSTPKTLSKSPPSNKKSSSSSSKRPTVIQGSKAQQVSYQTAPFRASVAASVHMAPPASRNSPRPSRPAAPARQPVAPARRPAAPAARQPVAPARRPVQQRAYAQSDTRHQGKKAPSQSRHGSSSRSGTGSHPYSSPRSLGPAQHVSAQSTAARPTAAPRALPRAYKENSQRSSSSRRQPSSSGSSPRRQKAVRGSVYDPQVAMQSLALPGFYGNGGSQERKEDRFQPRDLHIPTYEGDGHGAFYTDLRGRQVYTGPPSPTSPGGEEWNRYNAQVRKAQQFGQSNNIYNGAGFQYKF